MTRLDYVIENILNVLIELNHRQDLLEQTIIELVGRLAESEGSLSDETFDRAQELFHIREQAIKEHLSKEESGSNPDLESDLKPDPTPDDQEPEPATESSAPLNFDEAFPFKKAKNTDFTKSSYWPKDEDGDNV